MLTPIRQAVVLTGGSVTLHAWGADAIEAHTLDLLTVTATLGAMREDWASFARLDAEPAVWASFWRLVRASMRGASLPARLVWGDRLLLLEALWALNDVEDTEKKVSALTQKAAALLAHLSRGRMTT